MTVAIEQLKGIEVHCASVEYDEGRWSVNLVIIGLDEPMADEISRRLREAIEAIVPDVLGLPGARAIYADKETVQ